MRQIPRETSSEWNILGSRWSSDPQHVERTEGVRSLEAPRGEHPAPSFGPVKVQGAWKVAELKWW
jgi:hypothetical protein